MYGHRGCLSVCTCCLDDVSPRSSSLSWAGWCFIPVGPFFFFNSHKRAPLNSCFLVGVAKLLTSFLYTVHNFDNRVTQKSEIGTVLFSAFMHPGENAYWRRLPRKYQIVLISILTFAIFKSRNKCILILRTHYFFFSFLLRAKRNRWLLFLVLFVLF